jgi:hypothetical protein
VISPKDIENLGWEDKDELEPTIKGGKLIIEKKNVQTRN